MLIEIYTFEEFDTHLNLNNCGSDFNDRCNKLPFKPNFIVTWGNGANKKRDNKIQEWYNEQIFIGKTNKFWQCQIEFEKIEDVVAFKLRWI